MWVTRQVICISHVASEWTEKLKFIKILTSADSKKEWFDFSTEKQSLIKISNKQTRRLKIEILDKLILWKTSAENDTKNFSEGFKLADEKCWNFCLSSLSRFSIVTFQS